MPRLTKKAARQRILDRANEHIVKLRGNEDVRLGRKHLQRAVLICRQHKLVTPLTLERAGFRAKK